MNISNIKREELILLLQKYRTDAGVGKMLGCSRQLIHQLRKKFRINSSRKSIKSRNEKIFIAYKNKTNRIEMCRQFGLSTSHLYRVIKKMEDNWNRTN